MIFLGYILAVFMGAILGVLGGGGSILTVPILVYFFNIPASLATGYSLLVVGLTSAIGAYRYYTQNLLNFKIAFMFSLPSVVGVLFARKIVLPAFPNELFFMDLSLSKDAFIMISFSILVIVISLFMFKAKEPSKTETGNQKTSRVNLLLIGLEGFFVGALTGFVGAGGGFMIVPALVLFGNIALREAIATSLLIISIKSLSGVVGDLTESVVFDWSFIAIFFAITTVGVILGARLNTVIEVSKLRKGFAYFVLLMGILILSKEIF